jgi:hypothetical protein
MRADTAILTTLLPIKIVLSILPESEMIFSTIAARLLPVSAKDCIRILFTVVMAVSAEEKKAESRIRIRIDKACIGTLESNSFTPVLMRTQAQVFH